MRQDSAQRLVREPGSGLRVILRQVAGEGDAFLRKLVLDTVAMELGADAWPEPTRTQVLDLQVRIRLPNDFLKRQPESGEERETLIIEADGESAGMIVLTTIPGELKLTEIMIRPEPRDRGVRLQAIRLVLSAKSPVRLLVTSANSGAIRLYERLGFRMVSPGEVQCLMEYC